MIDPGTRARWVGRAAGLALLGGVFPIGQHAQAAEPWIAPQVAALCPHMGPNFIAIPGSRTCVRISGRVVADYDSAVRTHAGSPGRDGLQRLSPHAQVRVEARTETDLGDLTLVYQTDDPRRRLRTR